MTVTYRDGTAIVQIAAFVPSLLLGIFLCSRHGFAKSSGWVLLITFSLLRLAGASAQLVTISHPSTGAIIAAIVCESVGLSPLSLLCMGLLSRVNNYVPRQIPALLPKAVGIFSLVGISLGIYGAVKSSNSSQPLNINAESKAAITIFSLAFVVVVGTFFVLCSQVSSVKHGERRLLVAVALSCPFIAVRLVYALIAAWGNRKDFSYYDGNVTIYLCMAVIEEIIAVFICIATGLTLRVLPRDSVSSDRRRIAPQMASRHASDSSDTETGYPRNQYMKTTSTAAGTRNPHTPAAPRRGRGPISILYGYGKEAFQSRNG